MGQRVRYIEEPFNVTWPNKFVGYKADLWFTDYHSTPRQEQIEIENRFNFLKRTRLHYTLQYCKTMGLDYKTPFRFIKNALTGDSNTRYLIKDPIALFSAEWLQHEYDLDVVCMIRSPLSFVGSLKKANWDFDFSNISKQKNLIDKTLFPFKEEIISLSNNEGDYIDRACLLWNILHYKILMYSESHSEWRFVRYEDIAKEPLTHFSEIFDHLNLDFSIEVRDYIINYTSGTNPTETNTTAYKPRNSKDSIDTWKSRLTEHETQVITTKTKKIAKELY